MSIPPNKIVQKPPTNKEAQQQSAYKGENEVDARLRILKEEVLPTAPYILSTTTSLTPEHVKVQYPQNEINWRKYTLFCRGEDELQYLTFKDRSGDHDIRGMYARGGWDDGKGRIAPPEESNSRTSSDGTPRQGHASTKKKMTLADYKNRDKSKASQSAAVAAVSTKEGAKGADKNADHSTKEDVSKIQHSQPHGQKRSADSMTGAEDCQTIMHPATSPPSKKARSALEPSTSSLKGRPEARPPAITNGANPLKLDADQAKKPPHEAKVAKSTTPNKDQPMSNVTKPTESSMLRLPPMLSPLSSEIEEELAKMSSAAPNRRPGTAQSNISANSTSSVPTANRAITPTIGKAAKPRSSEKLAGIAKLPKPATPTKGPQEQKQATATSGHVARDAGSNIATTPKTASNNLSNGNKGTSTPTPKTTPDGPKRMRRRIVIPVKKKANRKNLANYLRMKPTPGRNSLFPNRPVEQQDATSAVIPTDTPTNRVDPKPSRPQGARHEIKAEAPKTGDKRGRAQINDEDFKDEPSSKRKANGRIAPTQKPSTPKLAPTSSPALSQLGSAQKPPTSTPRADINGAAMLRASSGQGSVHTPQISQVNGTPDTGRRRRSYTSPNKPVSPKSGDMWAEGSKYMETARDLKHDADAFMRKPEGMSDDDRKRGVLIGTESVLCFITAFTLLDTQRSHSDRAAWNSILAYLHICQEAAKTGDLGHMRGLLSQLEGIIRDQIAYVDLQQLDKDPFRHDPANSTADSAKAREVIQRGHELHSHFMKAQTAWRSGWMMLDVLDVQEQYPNTWAKRDTRRVAYGKARDAVFKGKYVRGYNLPMNNMTSGLEAVNFGYNFISEWSRAAGVEWTPRLTLTSE